MKPTTLRVDGQNVPVKNTSDTFSLNWRDILKGLIMAIGAPLLYFLIELIPSFPINPFLQMASAAFLTYLIKNFLSPGTVVIQKEDLKP